MNFGQNQSEIEASEEVEVKRGMLVWFEQRVVRRFGGSSKQVFYCTCFTG